MKIIRRLGKKVQAVLNKIFGKKERDGIEVVNTIFGPIDRETGMVVISAFGDGDYCELAGDFSLEPEELKKIANITYPILPKRIYCPTLLVSIAANQTSDYIAVDLSQFEENGIAHYISGHKESEEELLRKYSFGDSPWLFKEGLCSVAYKDGYLLHYEELGLWSLEF